VQGIPNVKIVKSLWVKEQLNNTKKPNYVLNAMKIETKPKKMRCGKCKKTSGIIKFYLFPDGEKIKPYHSACYKSLKVNQKK
jgi:late competence protein required for DNA uptake (superfamily II DNA/RNA helicase)